VPRRLLLAGTRAEYDWAARPSGPWREHRTCRSGSLYGTAKHAPRDLLSAFVREAEIGAFRCAGGGLA